MTLIKYYIVHKEDWDVCAAFFDKEEAEEAVETETLECLRDNNEHLPELREVTYEG